VQLNNQYVHMHKDIHYRLHCTLHSQFILDMHHIYWQISLMDNNKQKYACISNMTTIVQTKQQDNLFYELGLFSFSSILITEDVAR
jgi:hypothetical protein